MGIDIQTFSSPMDGVAPYQCSVCRERVYEVTIIRLLQKNYFCRNCLADLISDIVDTWVRPIVFAGDEE